MNEIYKAHSTDDYFDDFGLVISDKKIHFMENGIARISKKLKLSPVVGMNILWMDKDIRAYCKMADTYEKKRVGLQSTKCLNEKEGLYFPYPGKSNVVFHQGSVSYPLDLIFLADDSIIKIEANTKVGSEDKWSCLECDGVIEVNGGFCKAYDAEVGDRIALFATSERDLVEYEQEKYADSLLDEEDRLHNTSNRQSLVAAIAGII